MASAPHRDRLIAGRTEPWPELIVRAAPPDRHTSVTRVTPLTVALFLLLVTPAQAGDWDARARKDARQDRVIVAYDGVKPDSMVCDTTVRELADGTWMLLFLAGDSREPSLRNYIAVARSADCGKT